MLGWGDAGSLPTATCHCLGSRPCSNKSALRALPHQIEIGKNDICTPNWGDERLAFAEMAYGSMQTDGFFGSNLDKTTPLNEGGVD